MSTANSTICTPPNTSGVPSGIKTKFINKTVTKIAANKNPNFLSVEFLIALASAHIMAEVIDPAIDNVIIIQPAGPIASAE